MHTATLVSITPDAEELIAYCARVSNPANQNNTQTASRLLKYLIKHRHWSPFEMANMVVEIKTNRAIAAQILRHRSFSFQEFSQRYAEVQSIPTPPYLRRHRTVLMILMFILNSIGRMRLMNSIIKVKMFTNGCLNKALLRSVHERSFQSAQTRLCT